MAPASQRIGSAGRDVDGCAPVIDMRVKRPRLAALSGGSLGQAGHPRRRAQYATLRRAPDHTDPHLQKLERRRFLRTNRQHAGGIAKRSIARALARATVPTRASTAGAAANLSNA